MKKTTSFVVAAVTAAIVIGGGVGVAAAASSAPAPAATSDAVTPAAAASASATPTPSAAPWPYSVADEGEARFLEAVKAPDTIQGVALPSDAELLTAGREACEQLANGAAYDSIEVITDNPNPVFVHGIRGSATNSRNLVGLASETLCTEFSQLKVPTPPMPTAIP